MTLLKLEDSYIVYSTPEETTFFSSKQDLCNSGLFDEQQINVAIEEMTKHGDNVAKFGNVNRMFMYTEGFSTKD